MVGGERGASRAPPEQLVSQSGHCLGVPPSTAPPQPRHHSLVMVGAVPHHVKALCGGRKEGEK